MALLNHHSTQQLTRASFAPTSGRRALSGLLLLACGGLLLAMGVLAGRHYETRFNLPEHTAWLERERARLQDAVERAEVELELERATRLAMKQEMGELHDQVSELSYQLRFVTARRSDARAAR